MKTIDELQKAVVAYAERHEYGMAKMTSRYPDELYYSYKTFKDDVLEGKIVIMKNGKTKTVFKVNGEVTSIYK